MWSGQQCPLGHSCPYGSTKPTICLPGTYQSQPAQPSCQTCPKGEGNTSVSCYIRTMYACKICPKDLSVPVTGFYCQEGASSPMPCPAGTVSQVDGLQSLLDCSLCPPGFYCNISALTAPSGPCSAGQCHFLLILLFFSQSELVATNCFLIHFPKGHFCSSGATEPRPVSQIYGDICPAGYYCPKQSSAPLPCPVGHFLQDKGASSYTLCSPCPPGRYCIALGSSQPSGRQILNKSTPLHLLKLHMLFDLACK